MSKTPNISGFFLLERMQMKGGWTYIRLPGISADLKSKFGVVKVNGTIDSYQLIEYNLMPMKTGEFFLPIKAEIRKEIGKQEGDRVELTLFAMQDIAAMASPEDLITCLQDEPKAHQAFMNYSEAEQKSLLNWIAEAKHDEARVQRIARAIDVLLSRSH